MVTSLFFVEKNGDYMSETEYEKLPPHKKYGWKGGYEVQCEEEGCEKRSTRRYLVDWSIWVYFCDDHDMMLP